MNDREWDLSSEDLSRLGYNSEGKARRCKVKDYSETAHYAAEDEFSRVKVATKRRANE